MRAPAFLLTASLILLPAAHGFAQDAPAPAPIRTYALSLLGAPRLPADFPYFPFVNPDAPKGGEIVTGAVGTFDSFNPFIVRGSPAATGGLYDTLTVSDEAYEPGAAYGHLAQTIEIAADGRGVAFELRPEARFHDGAPITAEDVAWTFSTLRDQGKPFYRQYYADVSDVVVENPRRIVFHFKAPNRELAQILGELPVLPKHWWQGRDFTAPLTEPPLGSGPYKIGRFEFGRTLVMQRVPDYWARDLPTARGQDNFDTVRVEYFRDATVALEAFKAGQTDRRMENVSKTWATAYDFPAVRDGLVIKKEFPQALPTGMQAFGMNLRRKLFQDARVRQALALAFDFEWENANLFYGAYTRTESYFSNSELASSGIPTGDELALLEPFRDKLPPALFTDPFKLPVTDGSGNNREGLRRALGLLKDAGWTVKDRKLVDADGKPFTFEILLDGQTFERVALPYVQWLSRLGVDAHVRTVDPAQYERLLDTYDYDMTIVAIGESDSPGNEQTDFWTCGSAKQEGGSNYMGICDPVIEALVEKVVKAPNRASLVTATRALDRVLLWNWYVVPNWHQQALRVAFWDRFGFPDTKMRTGTDFSSWWLDPTKAARIDAARQRGN